MALLAASLGVAAATLLIAPMAHAGTPGAGADLTGGLTVLAIGFVFGLKHALDADHLVAVSTIVSEKRSAWSASLVGGLWGLGHTASLLIAGFLIIVLRLQVPERLAQWLEFSVAAMIVVLGANLLRTMLRSRGARIELGEHTHGPVTHRHPHVTSVGTPEGGMHGSWKGIGRKPFFVGMVHGLAGSAALMLLVLSEIRSPELGLLYILVFGVGSVGGMLIMSTLFSLPYLLLAGRFARIDFGLRVSTGIFSVLFGIYLMYQIGWSEHLFRITF
jgi:hypothetical protein